MVLRGISDLAGAAVGRVGLVRQVGRCQPRLLGDDACLRLAVKG